MHWSCSEAYFNNKLLDYEQYSNFGKRQWVKGGVVDTEPYCRIFNPTMQVKKFDKDLKYTLWSNIRMLS